MIHSTIDVSGVTPAADSDVDVMFTTQDGQLGTGWLVHQGIVRAILNIKHDNNGTLKWYDSPDGGVTWNQVGSHTATAVANEATYVEILIAGHADWKVEWTNGGLAQTSTVWDARLMLSTDQARAI